MRSVVVVGASLAGVEAARVLREEGYDGLLTVLGEEPSPPYDRPPLSKGFLNGSVDEAALRLPDVPELDLRLGTSAERLVPGERAVVTSSGDRVHADGVIVATGACARRLLTPLRAEQGVHVLRTLADATSLRADLVQGARMVVVGGGFIGTEVAATAVTLGLDVTIVEPQEQLLLAQLGPAVAPTIAALHLDRGAGIVTGMAVDEVLGRDRVRAVRLADGRELPADVVVVGIGSQPRTTWLQGSGIAVSDGVLCDGRGRTNVPNVVAVGDCAAWRDPEGVPERRQHWTAALRHAATGARALLGLPAEEQQPTDVDYVWSDQYDLRLQIAGRPDPDLACAVVSGTLGIPPFTVAFRSADHVVRAVASVHEPRVFGKWRRLVGTMQPTPSAA